MIRWPIYFWLVQHNNNLRPWNTSSVREYASTSANTVHYLSRSDNSALLIDSDKLAFAFTLAASTSLTSTYKMVSYLIHLSVLSIIKRLSYRNSNATQVPKPMVHIRIRSHCSVTLLASIPYLYVIIYSVKHAQIHRSSFHITQGSYYF